MNSLWLSLRHMMLFIYRNFLKEKTILPRISGIFYSYIFSNPNKTLSEHSVCIYNCNRFKKNHKHKTECYVRSLFYTQFDNSSALAIEFHLLVNR